MRWVKGTPKRIIDIMDATGVVVEREFDDAWYIFHPYFDKDDACDDPLKKDGHYAYDFWELCSKAKACYQALPADEKAIILNSWVSKHKPEGITKRNAIQIAKKFNLPAFILEKSDELGLTSSQKQKLLTMILS